MQPADMVISMPRGDLRSIRFTICDPQGEQIDEDFDEIYFSVKRHYTDKEFLFQKTLTGGGITKGEVDYNFYIIPEDTDNLAFGKYVFDIELVKNGLIKQTFTGDLTLTFEATHARNEGEHG